MKKYLFLAAAAIAFAACTNDNDLVETNQQTDERIPLAIGAIYGDISSNNNITRSPSTNLQAAKASNPIGLYILKGATTETQSDASNYEHFNLSSYSLIDNSPVNGYVGIGTGTTTLYYPDDKSQGISIYAYSPYTSSAPNNTKDISSDILSLSTSTDQKYDTGYLASDFLWGRQGEVVNSTDNIISAEKYKTAKTAAGSLSTGTSAILSSPHAAYLGVQSIPSATVYIPMVHLGSKITVEIVAGDGMDITKLKGATVSFYTDKQAADLKLSDGTLSNINGTAHTEIIIGKLGYSDDVTAIATGAADGSNGVKWDSSADDADNDNTMDDAEVKGYYCSGVILPQEIDASSVSLIEIKLNNTSTVYAYSPGSKPTFAASKKYSYKITVKASGISLTTSVTDWVEDLWGTASTPATGDAVLQ